MGFLKRLFGMDKPKDASTSARRTNKTKQTAAARSSAKGQDEDIPDYRVGLSGEYDESGLAKRVALAFDEDSQLDDIDTLWVAQTSAKVVLKGKVPSQDILDKMVSVARKVDGADSVDTSQVDIG